MMNKKTIPTWYMSFLWHMTRVTQFDYNIMFSRRRQCVTHGSAYNQSTKIALKYQARDVFDIGQYQKCVNGTKVDATKMETRCKIHVMFGRKIENIKKSIALNAICPVHDSSRSFFQTLPIYSKDYLDKGMFTIVKAWLAYHLM